MLLLNAIVINGQNSNDTLLIKSLLDDANIAEDIGDFQLSLNYAKKVLAIDSAEPIAYYTILRSYFQLDEFLKMSEYADMALKRDNDNISYLNAKSIAEHMLDNYEIAIKFANKAISLGSESEMVYIGRGHSYLRLGNFQQAYYDLKKGIELGANEADVFYLYGLAAYEVKDFEESLRYISYYIKHKDNNLQMQSFLYRAKLLMDYGYFEEALADLKTYTEPLKKGQIREEKFFYKSQPDVIQGFGISYAHLGAFDKAIKYLNESLQFESSRLNNSSIYYSKSHFFMAIIYFNLEDLENVKYHLKAMIEIVPEEGTPYLQLAKVYHNEEDYDTALSYLEQIGNKTTDLTDRKEYLNDIAKLYIQYGEIDKAIHYHLEYLKLNPDDSIVTEELAGVFMKDIPRYINEFIAYYDIFASKHQTNSKEAAYYHAVKALLYMEVNDLDSALTEINKAIEIDPFSEYFCVRSLLHFREYHERADRFGQDKSLMGLETKILQDIDAASDLSHKKADTYLLKTTYLIYFDRRNEACKAANQAAKFGGAIDKKQLKFICKGKEPKDIEKYGDLEVNFNLSTFEERFVK